jgi:hypothetical protein
MAISRAMTTIQTLMTLYPNNHLHSEPVAVIFSLKLTIVPLHPNDQLVALVDSQVSETWEARLHGLQPDLEVALLLETGLALRSEIQFSARYQKFSLLVLPSALASLAPLGSVLPVGPVD